MAATIDEELSGMERDIRQLKIEYDQFFGGGRKRPPTEIEWRIEQVIKRHGERAGELKFGQRFRLTNLTQTYAKYKDIFRKKTALKEEGRSQKHYGAAAKMIEAERERAKAHHEPPPVVPPPSAREEAPVSKRAVASVASNGSNAFRVVCADPEHETENVDLLFQAFVSAKKQAGEETSKLSQAGFKEFVRKKTKDLQEKQNCHDVEYVVETVAGQVKLKALVKS
ncbi:MAG TPA: MXAN_5187 C-terminal domain-containing protein [Candidatus Sulfotelmatobacter sp.]|nr:MXAN_5187 C-terminal domain-containing protein [Candidatus Sulfotelmatobacter sp.]